jgi:hypothetical protein
MPNYIIKSWEIWKLEKCVTHQNSDLPLERDANPDPRLLRCLEVRGDFSGDRRLVTIVVVVVKDEPTEPFSENMSPLNDVTYEVEDFFDIVVS